MSAGAPLEVSQDVSGDRVARGATSLVARIGRPIPRLRKHQCEPEYLTTSMFVAGPGASRPFVPGARGSRRALPEALALPAHVAGRRGTTPWPIGVAASRRLVGSATASHPRKGIHFGHCGYSSSWVLGV